MNISLFSFDGFVAVPPVFFFGVNDWSEFGGGDSSFGSWGFANIGGGGDDLLLGDSLEHLLLRELGLDLGDFSLGWGLHKVKIAGLTSGGNSSLLGTHSLGNELLLDFQWELVELHWGPTLNHWLWLLSAHNHLLTLEWLRNKLLGNLLV